MANRRYEGGCHCGQIRFRFHTPEPLEVIHCNCSVCRMAGFEHIIIPREHFELLGDEHALAEYRFNTGTARHLFCRRCGIKSFYVPRSHPNGISINFRCVDGYPDLASTSRDFDGSRWEDNIESIR